MKTKEYGYSPFEREGYITKTPNFFEKIFGIKERTVTYKKMGSVWYDTQTKKVCKSSYNISLLNCAYDLTT